MISKYPYQRNILIVAATIFFTSLALVLHNCWLNCWGSSGPVKHLLVYLYGNVLVLAISFGCFILALRGWARFGTLVLLWYTHVLNVSFGQFYFQHYFVGYVEGALAIAFLIPASPGIMAVLQLSGVAIFLSSALLSPTLASEPGHQLRFDIVMSVLSASALAYLAFYFVLEERRRKQEIFRKFADLGQYSATLLHDVKNLITTPGLNAELLKRLIHQNPKLLESVPEQKMMIDRLICGITEELKNIREYLFESEQVAMGSEKEAELNLCDLVQSVKTVLGSKLDGIKFECLAQGVTFKVKRRCLARSILNAMTNAVDALRSSQVPDPKITVRVEGSRIIISDNGPGFPKEIIEKIRRNRPVSAKQSGSGIGIMIIKDYLQELGGSAHFSNGNAGTDLLSGAVVSLCLPPRSRTDRQD